MRQSGRLRVSIVRGVTVVAGIAAFGFGALRYVYLTVAELAGRHTAVSGSVAVIVTAMVGGGSGIASLVYGVGWAKMKAQARELERLRKRCRELEAGQNMGSAIEAPAPLDPAEEDGKE